MADVEVGQEAPDFTLRNEELQPVTLSELRGSPVVLVFYPAAFSGLCTSELCGIRDDFSEFEARGAKVFGISGDNPFALKAFREQEHLAHPLLSDIKGDVATQYGSWNEQLGVAERMTVVIDKDGIIRYVIHNQMGQARDHKEALAAIG